MSNLRIERVTTRQQQKLFLEYPWTLYRNDPNWIPPLRDDQKRLVGYKPHPFYARNRVQTFLATRDDVPCGRIAAILNQGHNLRYNEKLGFWGFFDCNDDQEAATGLFDAVRDWFAEQGIHKLRGPTNPSLNYALGLLIDGFDTPPTFMMTYNPPYYERLVEHYGFRKTQDLYAFWGHIDMLPKIGEKLRPVAMQIMERYNVQLRPLDRKHFKEDVALFLSLYNRSLSNTWGFVPMSPEEVRHMANDLKYVIIPEMAIAAEMDGHVVGASFGLPDYNPRIRDIDGRLFPFGFLHMLRNRQAIKRIRLISTNVLPEYQRLGIGMLLMHGFVPQAIKWGLEEAEFSWVLESNSLSYGALKKGGAKITKTYRLYDWEDENESQRAAEKNRSAARPQSLVPRPPVDVRQVENREDRDRFLKLPWRIYAEDPHWVPPLLVDVKEFLNRRKHPFYQHGDAAQFVAVRGDQTVGRILVSDDPRYNQQHRENVGCFGMFDCIDDQATAHALLEAAAGWLHAKGRTVMRGPIDYSLNYPSGLLIDGFDTPPRIMMNHNRRYYADLLESWGLKKAKDLYAWWFVDPLDLVEKWKPRLEKIGRRSGVTVRPFHIHDLAAELTRCQTIYNSAMEGLWGSVSLSDAELQYFAKRLSQVAVPEQVLLAEVNGQVVGFSITLPDFNEATGPLNGRLTRFGLPIGLAQLMRHKRHITTARMIVLDVLKDYRHRGIGETLILKTLDYGKNVLGYTGAELGWTIEDNQPVNRTIESVGARRYKTYRIYEKSLADASSQ